MNDEEQGEGWRRRRWRHISDHENLCLKCTGSGRRMYGSTATWRGGMGGAKMTVDVCDECWGSGTPLRPGMDLRKHLDEVDISVAERALDLIGRSVGASMSSTHPAIRIIAETLEKLANKRGVPAAPHLPEVARGLAKTLRRALGETPDRG